MSHAWTGFGFLLIATVLQTTALVLRIENILKAKAAVEWNESLMGSTLCALTWIGLISALRVVLTPSHGGQTQCGLVESIASSQILVLWAVLFVVLRNSGGKAKMILEEIPVRSIIVVNSSFSVVAFLSSELLSTTGRVGMFCFFEAQWLHAFLTLWFMWGLFQSARKAVVSKGTTAERVSEDDRSVIFSSESQFNIHCVVVAAASFSLLVAYMVVGKKMGGLLGFWELWLLMQGVLSVRRERADL